MKPKLHNAKFRSSKNNSVWGSYLPKVNKNKTQLQLYIGVSRLLAPASPVLYVIISLKYLKGLVSKEESAEQQTL